MRGHAAVLLLFASGLGGHGSEAFVRAPALPGILPKPATCGPLRAVRRRVCGVEMTDGARKKAQEGVAGKAAGQAGNDPKVEVAARRREVRGSRAMAQWIAAERKGRVKVVVAASELEFSLAESTLLMPPQAEDDVRAAFATFDVDGSGAIDTSELREGMLALGVEAPQQEIEALMEVVYMCVHACVCVCVYVSVSVCVWH
jgi:hypothetical protein